MEIKSAPTPRAGVLKIKSHMLSAGAKPDPSAIQIASNESVYGPGDKALAAAHDSLSHSERYPEGASEILAGAIASRFNLNADNIVCGFGSDDLLARLARIYLSPGDELIYPVHGYQKVPNYAFANDAIPVSAPDENFIADVDQILACITERTKVVMLANPDNPSGTYVSGQQVRKLHAGLPPHVLLVLDSAYAEYVMATDYELPTTLVEEAGNVVMTRTFSKVFGLAGMRVGWMYGPIDIVDAVRRVGITFPLSAPSLAACMAALKDSAHQDFVVTENFRIREEFAERIGKLGLQVVPSQTNFVLVRFGTRDAQGAQNFLQKHGVIARQLSAGDFSDCIRFTIGDHQQMSTTAEVLEKWNNE
ncbi:MAG: histidinol-phosphate aminotransferase [Parasphingorhabdus sp.]